MMEASLANFHFIRPFWLLALIPAFALFMMLFRFAKKRTEWQGVIAPHLLPFLLDGELSKANKTPYWILMGLWIVSVISLAGPTWQKIEAPVSKNQSAMVLLWDLSPSMYAKDIKPSRVVRSRLKLNDLLNERKEGLTALVAYGGDAHVVTPLTDDTRTIKSLLPGLEPAVLPAQGSQPELALELAINLLKESGVEKGDIVFLTDGIAPSAVLSLGSMASNTSHRVTVWSIGTADGAPIPQPQGGFVRNKRGEIVVAKVDDNELSEAAVSMGGVYIPFSADTSDIDSILYFGFQQSKITAETNDKTFDEWQESGHWLVLLLLPFVLFAFRRGLVLCVLAISFMPYESQAIEWKDLWQTKNQQAQKQLNQNNAQAAAENFTDPDWEAAAQYRAGNFEAAEQLYTQSNTAQGAYNLGNALTHLGKYDEAIEAYDNALELDKSLSDAAENKKIAEQLKKMQEQQQQQNGEGGDQSEQNEKQDSSENQNNSQEQNTDQESDSNEQNSAESDSDQQNQSDENNQENANESNDSQQESEESKQALDEKQKQALDKQYKEQIAEQSEQEAMPPQREVSEEEKNNENKDESDMAMIQQDTLSDAEKEQQQALEQWLRRVPDDPSGLLRKKFDYEYQRRRLELQQSRSLRSPNAQEEERW